MNEIDLFEEYFPGKGLKARCQRNFLRFISIDPNGQKTKNNLKSLTVVKAETLRHLLFHRYKIHCFSRFRGFWELLMILNYSLAFIFLPYDVAFVYDERRLQKSTVYTICLIIDTICLLDIIVNFLSCYQDQNSKTIVLNSRKIACKYMRFYFWIDLLSSFPDFIFLLWFKDREVKGNNLARCLRDGQSSQCVWELFVLLSLLKFMQMPLFFKYLLTYLQRWKMSSYSIKIIRNFLAFVFLYHFTVCLSFLIIRIFVASSEQSVIDQSNSLTDVSFWNGTSDFDKYVICFYYTTYTVTLFASTVEEKSQIDMTVGIIFTLIGYVLHIWLVSEAFMFLKTYFGPSIRFHENRYHLQEYVAFKHLPNSVQQRILTFYDFCFHNKFFRKKEINELLGSGLTHLITEETCQLLLMHNSLFKQLPENLLHSIASSMIEEVYLKNDVIYRNDQRRGQKMYLIVHGTVAMYTEEGDELGHLVDGSIFGEVEFLHIYESKEILNYVAVEESLLLILNRNDFMRIMAENNKLLSGMRETVNWKIQEIKD